MKILVVNCGSSSIKYKLYDMVDKTVLAAGGVEKIGLDQPFLKIKFNDGSSKKVEGNIPTHTEGIEMMFEALLDPNYGAIKSLDEIGAAGHRIVHGGIFTKSVIVTDDIINEWKQYGELAPLHSDAHLKGYEAVKNKLPHLKQVFVFDTAFHQTMPDYAYMYAIPFDIYKKYHIRRYGFHGTSHRYVTQRAGEMLGFNPAEKKMITCHIGNGASIAAIDHGKVVDTSMGLTPLEGLMMGTRTGDIDSSAILYIMKETGLPLEEASDYLNKKCGLLGVSGVSSDIREVEAAVAAGNERAKLGLRMYNYRIKKYIGAYTAAMGGVDYIIFTAGVGEHQADIREESVKGLEFLGIQMDNDRNQDAIGKEAIISTDNSKVTMAVIPTDEEMLIATDTLKLVTE